MKSLSFMRDSGLPSADADAADIDVTPIMNMFIILIPFLVSMAVFTHLAIIEFSLPPNVGSSLDDSQGRPKLKVTVVVAVDYLALTYGEQMLDSIPAGGGLYDLNEFHERLVAARNNADVQDEVIVAVKDRVRFENVVQVMDKCREAGFEKTGLSSATENPDTGT